MGPAEAEGTTDGWGVALEGVAADVAEVMNDGPVDMSGVTAAWRDVRFTSRAAAADAGAKIATVVPGLADTEVGLELLGLSPDQIRRFLAERRGAAGRGVVCDKTAWGMAIKALPIVKINMDRLYTEERAVVMSVTAWYGTGGLVDSALSNTRMVEVKS